MGYCVGVGSRGGLRSIVLMILFFSAAVWADSDWSVSPDTLSVIAYEAGDDPNDALLTLSNSGDTSLDWVIYDANEMSLSLPAWLNVMPVSGSVGTGKSRLMLVQAFSSELSAGIYEYAFDVVDTADPNSRQRVDVSLEVLGAILGVSADTFVFPFDETNFDTEQTLTVQNTGGGVLEWSIHDPNETFLTLPGWLSVDSTGGSLAHDETAEIVLTVDRTDLARGRHIFEFEVSAENAQNSPVLITVQVDIAGIIYVPGHFGAIQEAIDAAELNETIVVLPGIYNENLDFNGKDVVLMSQSSYDPDVTDATYINGGGMGSVVTFNGQETPACVLRGLVLYNGYQSGAGGGISGSGTQAGIEGCVIAGNIADWGGGLCACDGAITNCLIVSNAAYYDGGGLAVCDGVMTHCTIADNLAGDDGGGLFDCLASITNCIIWGNDAAENVGLYEGSTPTYSCIQDWESGGTGNIVVNPLFADPDHDDYHLKSQYGRWDPNNSVWVSDTLTSPCIDGGMPERISFVNDNGTPSDPNDDYTDEYADPNAGWTEELWPHGERANMGAYGGTPQASMSPNPTGNLANLNHDGGVDGADFVRLIDDWLLQRFLMDTDLDRDGDVDYGDFSLFSGQWLSPVELLPPPAPTGLALTVGELEVELDWDDSDYGHFGSYRVYRAVGDANYLELLASGLTESGYVDPNLCDGSTYYYVVTIQSAFGSESEYSEMVSAAFEGPSAPTGLSPLLYEDRVELDWDDSEYIYWGGYNVYRSLDPDHLVLIESGVTDSEYVDDAVVGGLEYYYAVTTVSACGAESAYSDVVFANPPYDLNDRFEGGFGNWSNVSDDDADWSHNFGGTPSAGTGPSSGANGTSRYVYVEGGQVSVAGEVAILEGPEINGFDRQMTFYYHMYGEHMGTLNVDVKIDGVWDEGIWSLSGQQQTSSSEAYRLATVDLSGYTGLITLRFRFVSIGGYAADAAIDEITISGVQ